MNAFFSSLVALVCIIGLILWPAAAVAAAQLPPCRDGLHTVGAWLPVEGQRFECPNGSHAISHDKQDFAFHNGHKVFEWSGGCGCSANAYTWTPTHCQLPSWNATKFCDILGNRIVYLAGDSTMHQAAVTLMEMIRVGQGDCASQIYYGLSFYLIFKLQNDFKWHNWFLNKCERCSGEQWPPGQLPDIVVLTAGAHQEDVGDMMTIWAALEEDFKTFRTNFFWHNMTFVWKTQAPGHVNCYNDSAPLAVDTYPTGPGPDDRYNYWHFKQFDEFSRNASRANGVRLLDLSPLYLRPDAHLGSAGRLSEKRDCLHMCLPGPVNLFSVLLQSMLENGEI